MIRRSGADRRPKDYSTTAVFPTVNFDAIAHHSIRLSWQPLADSTGQTAWRVQRSTDDGQTFTTVATIGNIAETFLRGQQRAGRGN